MNVTVKTFASNVLDKMSDIYIALNDPALSDTAKVTAARNAATNLINYIGRVQTHEHATNRR